MGNASTHSTSVSMCTRIPAPSRTPAPLSRPRSLLLNQGAGELVHDRDDAAGLAPVEAAVATPGTLRPTWAAAHSASMTRFLPPRGR